MALDPIKKFKPRHDLVVLLHMQGKKNIDIAETLSMTPERIYQILDDPKSAMMVDRFRKQMQEHFMEDLETNLIGLGPEAVKNLAETINAEVAVSSRVKKHQDDVSFKLLDRIGFAPMSKDNTGTGSVKFDRDIQERIAGALESTRQIVEYDEAEEAEWMEGSDTVTSRNSTGSGRNLGTGDNGAAPNAPDFASSVRSTQGGEMVPSPLVLPKKDDK